MIPQATAIPMTAPVASPPLGEESSGCEAEPKPEGNTCVAEGLVGVLVPLIVAGSASSGGGWLRRSIYVELLTISSNSSWFFTNAKNWLLVLFLTPGPVQSTTKYKGCLLYLRSCAISSMVTEPAREKSEFTSPSRVSTTSMLFAFLRGPTAIGNIQTYELALHHPLE